MNTTARDLSKDSQQASQSTQLSPHAEALAAVTNPKRGAKAGKRHNVASEQRLKVEEECTKMVHRWYNDGTTN